MPPGPHIPLPWRMVAGLLVVSFVTPPYALANPQGAQVRQGQVRIDAAGSQLRIHQQSQRAVIDWQSFSIDRGETTRFVQPNSAAAVLNRVRGDSASQIEGMLRANGKVYLINPNGILVGPNGTIDVGGFVASTLDVGDRAFMKGGDLRFSGNSDAAVVNLGAISALDGDVVLMGASVLNAGSIRAPRGTAALAAGNDILLAESGEERVFVRGGAGSVTNTGSIEANVAELKAHGGNIYGMAVKNEGRVAATGVTKRGGQIFLTAKGGKVRSTGSLKATRSDGSGGRVKVDSGRTESRTEIGGTVDASGRAGAGGEIVILGNEIEIFEGALILNDGATMGGNTRIGGGLRGEDPRFANARSVTVGSGALISANAGAGGNGGLVVVFAEGSLVFDGAISARGGSEFGNGGFAELSGKETVRVSNLAGRIDLSAPAGDAGTFLYDPTDIAILPGSASPIGGSPVTQNILYAGDIASFLATANLIVTTASVSGTDIGNITMDGAANITWNSASSLTFLADNDFAMNPGATIHATGAGAFSVTAARAINIGNGASITTTNGNLTLSANQQATPTSGNFVGIHVNGGTVQSLGTGSVALSGRGGNSLNNNDGVLVGGGGLVGGGTGTTLSITGLGGASTGNTHRGVAVVGGSVTSLGGSVSISGTGGGTGISSASNSGIFLSNGSIQAGNGGSLSLVGAGGSGGGLNHKGVWVSGATIPATIATAGGSLSIAGTGGGTDASSNNQGVDLAGAQVLVSATGGVLTITGTGGAATALAGIRVSGTLTTPGGAGIELASDGVAISTGTTIIDSGAGTTTIRPLTPGFAIDLGGADSATSLGLTDAELDRITAGTLQIGNANAGQITVSAPLTHGNHLTLTTGAGVAANSSVTMAANRNLAVSALGTTNGTISVTDSLAASGTGTISLTTSRRISLGSGAGVTSVNGDITLSANQQDTPAWGDFVGISINGATVQTTGSGNLDVFGRGGGGEEIGGGQHGIQLINGALLSGGATGTLTVEGTGGDADGDGNDGVFLAGNGTRIGSDGGNVSVSGTGGSYYYSANRGVHVRDGASIASGGAGTVTVVGWGGGMYDYGWGGNSGVFVTQDGIITSSGGNVSVTGTGGGGDSSGNHGVFVEDLTGSTSATISAGGLGHVFIEGIGGATSESGPADFPDFFPDGDFGSEDYPVFGDNHGVFLLNAGALIGSEGGAVSITGQSNESSFATHLANGAAIQTNGGALLLEGDSLEIGNASSVASGAGTTIIVPLTSGFAIDLGGVDMAGSALGLTDAELDRISAGLVQIGNANTGPITVSAAVTHANHLFLATGAGVAFNSSVTMAANRNLSVSAFGTTNGTISVGAALAASGSGTIFLSTPRDITLGTGSSITTVDGNLTLSANQQAAPTSGDFTGISISGAALASTGEGSMTLLGRGGDVANGAQAGIRVGEGSSLSTAGGELTLTGVSRDADSSGIFFALADVNAGGGILRLRGTGAGDGGAIGSDNTLATIGSALDTVLVQSFSGDVSIVGSVRGSDLQLRDSTAFASVAFTLENPANDVAFLSAIGFNDFGGIGSLSYRDANGFTISEYSEMGGINAVNSITLRGGATGAVVVEQNVTSSSGNILVVGHDLVVDGAEISTGASGWINLDADRAILVRADSLVSVVDGDLSVSANMGETPPLPGRFTGITVLGSTFSSSGEGGISLAGRGGDGSLSPDFSYSGFTNTSSAGVRIAGGSVLVSSGTGEDAGAITIDGQGGGGASDSVGVVIDGTATLVQTADSDLSVLGYGGGNATGFRNRGILVSGATVQAGNAGALSLEGWGGQGVGMVDGIQFDGNATLQVEDGLLRLVGNAGGSFGIGVMATSGSGDIRSVGTGAIEISGAGSNAAGVNLGNSGASLGGASSTSLLVESQGDLVLGRPSSVAGPVTLRALSDEIFVNAPATSTGGDLRLEGFDLTVNAALSAPVGNLTLQFGESDPLVSAPLDGIARVNALLTHGGAIGYVGGSGLGDTLTFAGYTASALEFDFALLTGIENVVGTAFTTDRLLGPATESLYEFGGDNAFAVGGVSFSAFENVLGGDGDDSFAFAASATLGGALDGGGGTNTLDYAAYDTGVIVNLEGGGATGIVGGFSNITSFSGSGNIDTVTGPGSASLYEINAPDSVQVGSASVVGFENLVGGPLNDRFLFLPGASLTGTLDGGGGADILDYSGFGAPVAINFATAPLPLATGITGGFSRIGQFVGSAATSNAVFGPNAPTTYQIAGANAFSTPLFTATSFQNLSGGTDADRFLLGPGASLGGRLSGGAGSDTLSFASFGRPVTVEIGPNTATGLGGGFAEMETIIGSSANDRFRFLNQATIDLVDGGGGTDLLEIDDTNLGGDQTYTITANSISRNPVYNFRNFEAVRLFLGNGNNTVDSGFYAFNQFLHAGSGFNILNLPGVSNLDGANPIDNVRHFGFDAPRPAGTDTGGLLKLQVEQRDTGTGLQTQQGFQTENRFSIVDPATLNSQIGALGNAFSAAIVAQAIVISVEGNTYLVLRPFSLDGSGLQPSNLGLAAMQENLSIEANLELAAAIGFDGAIFLINPDGPFALDLSGVPADPAILTLLNESLAIAAASELSAALGLNLVVGILAGDGIVPTALDGGAPGAGVVVILTEQLSDPAAAELNAALPPGN